MVFKHFQVQNSLSIVNVPLRLDEYLELLLVLLKKTKYSNIMRHHVHHYYYSKDLFKCKNNYFLGQNFHTPKGNG